MKDLAAENHLQGLKKAAFVDRLTHHYGEINYWHPMREGNGRVTKVFLQQLANQAGYKLELARASEKTWNSAAARQTGEGDPRWAGAMFEKITMPRRAIAFRDEHILDAVKKFPELEGAANALAAAERKASAEFDAGTQREFIARVHAKLLERLMEGEIIRAAARDRPAKDDPLDYGR